MLNGNHAYPSSPPPPAPPSASTPPMSPPAPLQEPVEAGHSWGALIPLAIVGMWCVLVTVASLDHFADSDRHEGDHQAVLDRVAAVEAKASEPRCALEGDVGALVDVRGHTYACEASNVYVIGGGRPRWVHKDRHPDPVYLEHSGAHSSSPETTTQTAGGEP